MTTKKGISIITPVFNGESYIANCILNVIREKNSLLEHLIIDGQSTDQTIKILDKYSKTFPHIRYLSEKDNGQSDAMNKGISLAKGEIIGFLNVDDYYEPGTLNKVQEIFRSLPEPSLVVGNCNVWSPENKLLFVNKPSKLTLFDLVSGRPFPVNPSSYFYHKSIHDKVGLYDVNDTHSMDLDFLLRAIQHANIVYIDETWGNFRMVEGSKTLEESERNITFYRMKKVLNKYRKKLPLLQRIHSKLNFLILELGLRGLRTLRKLNIDTTFFTNKINH